MAKPEEPRDSDNVSEEEADSEEEYAPTPFDNPFFLPVLLMGFAGERSFEKVRDVIELFGREVIPAFGQAIAR